MAKQQTARTTIKNDPFATVIPMNGDAEAEAPEEAPAAQSAPPPQLVAAQPFRRQKLTVHLRTDLAERVKNAAYWNPRLTIASIAEMGIFHALELIEKDHGGPYPPREEELRGGRPMK
ncbi:MAG: hypothetical protein U0746_10545 [Gemmataceae bacterium]